MRPASCPDLHPFQAKWVKPQCHACPCLVEFQRARFCFSLVLVGPARVQSFSLCFHFDQEERRSREEFEQLLHVAMYLIFDEGILVGMIENTSAIAIDLGRPARPVFF